MTELKVIAKVRRTSNNELVNTYHAYTQYSVINYFVTRYNTDYFLEVEGIKCGINYYLACLYLHLYRTKVDPKKSKKRWVL